MKQWKQKKRIILREINCPTSVTFRKINLEEEGASRWQRLGLETCLLINGDVNDISACTTESVISELSPFHPRHSRTSSIFRRSESFQPQKKHPKHDYLLDKHPIPSFWLMLWASVMMKCDKMLPTNQLISINNSLLTLKLEKFSFTLIVLLSVTITLVRIRPWQGVVCMPLLNENCFGII